MIFKPATLLIGLGDLGTILLRLLAQNHATGKIIAASRNEERTIAACNMARISAVAGGFSPDIVPTRIDLHDKNTLIETVEKEKPDIIINTAAMQTWWLPDLLPEKQNKLIKKAGFGIWFPVHCTLTLKLMEALKEIDYTGITLSAPFPDVVNNVLGKIDLAPTCGVGNIDEMVAKTKIVIAKRYNVSVDSVKATMVGHHSLQSISWNVKGGKLPPYYMRIELKGRDITGEIDSDEMLRFPYPLPGGSAINFLTATSAVTLISALFAEQTTFLHAPGPLGLPGGYPVEVGNRSVQIASIPGLSLEEAVSINERSHRYDGIESVENDGTVVFCKAGAEIFDREMQYKCDKVAPDDCEEKAHELIAKFKEYAAKHGVQFDT